MTPASRFHKLVFAASWSLAGTASILAPVGSLAEESAGTITRAASADRRSNLSLSRGGGTHRPWVWALHAPRATIWMAGVLHVAGEDEAAHYRHYHGFYAAARSLYFETAPGAWGTFGARRLLAHHGTLPKSSNLSRVLSPEGRRLVEETAGHFSEGFPAILHLRPWLASLEVEKATYLAAGLDAESSLEHQLAGFAVRDRKPVGALESPAEQIAPLVALSTADQEAALVESLRDFAGGAPGLQRVREAWISGDLERMRRALRAVPVEERSALQRALIDQRNLSWVAKIAELAKGREDVLVVVGVSHLVTPGSGLPDILARSGFAVRRVD